ncbi:serine carboxypeptidase-like 42 isoform X2 [Quercus suber]|uniref:serine carboxypeptidase-like 42 isoform X2 n=1 Tax=Quercus suber TaxID=58331 RepID=UPI000CE25236|nr:serine carboxypeptidase-like 42 isoform X2 [Quercus suber]POE54768.1 serine carboxypeptidase-like 42 [Quercus suber]
MNKRVGFFVSILRIPEMGHCWFSWVLVVLLVLLGVSVKGYPVEDLVVKLPGQPKVEFRQYAGYVDVDVKAGRSLFYHFVEAESQPDKKPLALWLNGGPGCSSIGGGAFTELGPFYPRGDGRSLRKNSMSWSRGVGWSYSKTSSDYTWGDASTAKDMLVFMLKWYEKFPDFKSRELFLTGESYAGHYIPQLAIALLDYNAHSTGFKFNIKGVAIGNPLLRLDRDVPATYEFFWSHGMISDEVGLTIMSKCDFDDYVFASPHNQADTCNNAINEANNIVGTYIHNYDVILDICYPSIAEHELRLRKVQAQVPPTSLPVSNSPTTGDTWFGRKALASDIPSLHRELLKGYSQPSAPNPDTYILASTSSSTNHKTVPAPSPKFPFQRRKLLKGYTQPSAPNPDTYIPAAPTPSPKFPLLRRKLLKGYTRPSTPNPTTYIPASTNHKAAPTPLLEFSLLRRKLLRGYTPPSAPSPDTYIPASASTLANHKTAPAPSPN